MALVLVEGFDHMIVSLVTSKAWQTSPTSMTSGRFGGQAARFTTGTSLTLAKALPSTYATLIAGFAYRSQFAAAINFFAFRVGGTTIMTLGLNATAGKLVVKNVGGTTIATGTTNILANVWNYYEIKAFVNGASGTCEVRLNGAAEIASTVGNFGSTNIDTVAFLNGANNSNMDYDDLYVLDTSGSAPRNTFLGDVRVETLYPSADGAHLQWTPNSGTAHFSRVNESTSTFPDGDTSYVSDANVGDIDTYACDDLSISSGTLYGLQTVTYARKDDAGTRQIAHVCRQGGSDSVGTTLTMPSSYGFQTDIRAQDPSSAEWTISNVNADEFGVKVIA